jgi:hypothetical protein
MNVKRFLGIAWAAPVTFFGLVYVLVFSVFGWYKFSEKNSDALVWKVDHTRAPKKLLSMWKKWSGQTIGNVIVLNVEAKDRYEKIMNHELEHVSQYMRMGVFFPVFYALMSLGILWGCKYSHFYYSNPLEIDARRGANQIIDIEGALIAIGEKKNV